MLLNDDGTGIAHTGRWPHMAHMDGYGGGCARVVPVLVLCTRIGLVLVCLSAASEREFGQAVRRK